MYRPRGVRYDTVRRYVLLGMGTVCRYVLLGTGTVWVRYMGTTCFQKMWCYFQDVLLAPHFGNSTTFSENRYGGYTVPVRRTYGPYPRTVYPYRTRTIPASYPYPAYVPTVRPHRTSPQYVPVPMPKSYPVLGSPGTG